MAKSQQHSCVDTLLRVPSAGCRCLLESILKQPCRLQQGLVPQFRPRTRWVGVLTTGRPTLLRS